MQVTIGKEAMKQGRKVPADIFARLAVAVGRYAENRNAAIDVKAMQGMENTYRIRVGDWRLIFTVEGDTMTVTKIAPRGSMY